MGALLLLLGETRCKKDVIFTSHQCSAHQHQQSTGHTQYAAIFPLQSGLILPLIAQGYWYLAWLQNKDQKMELILKLKHCFTVPLRDEEIISKVSIIIGHFRVLLCLCFKTSLSAKAFLWNFIFMQIKVNFIRMVSHLDSLWNRGTRELGNGLLSTYLHQDLRPEDNTNLNSKEEYQKLTWVLYI